MSDKGVSINAAATGGNSRPDKIASNPESAPAPAPAPAANQSDEIAYSSASEKAPDLSEKPQDYVTHENSLDEESGNVGQVTDRASEGRSNSLAIWYRKLRPLVHFLIWALWTM